MQRYNNTSLAFAEDTAYADGFEKIEEYLSAEDGYWLNEDVWEVNSGKFEERRIDLSGRKKGNIADFTMIRSYTIRTELKYCILKILTEKTIKAAIFSSSYKSLMRSSSIAATSSLIGILSIGMPVFVISPHRYGIYFPSALFHT